MICKNCGNGSIIDGSKFCNNCGASLKFAEKDPDIQMTPKEEPDEVVEKGKYSTCGKVGLGLYLAAVALQVITELKARQNPAAALSVSLALKPIAGIFILGALALAIVSKVRKEQGSSANITIGLMIISVIYYIIIVLKTY